ncbi:MAG: hypothetical protein VXY16_06345 [Pseudomonadota bacterium]|nr:hypothetical protein [Pseudomonadota bacterium]
MQVNIQEFLETCGLDEPIYPGKRVVKKLPQPGEHKSHCIVYDWRDPSKIRVEVKAGLSGRDLDPKELRKYPVSFQSPTYLELEVGAKAKAAPKKAAAKTKAKGGKK